MQRVRKINIKSSQLEDFFYITDTGDYAYDYSNMTGAVEKGHKGKYNKTAIFNCKAKEQRMSRLVIGTNNVHKTREIKQILYGFYDEILSLKEAGIDLEVVEDAQTLEENAIKKAREASKLSGCDTLADDTGLMVDALGGAPGVYSARYAGENVSYEQNNIKLLKELEGESNRSAKFVCVMALVKDGKVLTAKGEVPGVITTELLGDQGFGYDPLFYSTELGKTFAQASAEEKNSISHRARALMALKEKLEQGQD